MSMLDLTRNFQAYRHNGDDKALARLGLKTHGYVPSDAEGNWIDLGTVELHEATEQMVGRPQKARKYPATTVKVEVSCYPAQFWRFTIIRPDEKIVEGKDGNWSVRVRAKKTVLSTGSGGFREYWEVAEKFAKHMVEVDS